MWGYGGKNYIEQTTMENLEQIKFIKLKHKEWISHILRRETDNIVGNVFECNPKEATRRCGRPKITWYNIVTLEAGKLGKSCCEIKDIARNRIS